MQISTIGVVLPLIFEKDNIPYRITASPIINNARLYLLSPEFFYELEIIYHTYGIAAASMNYNAW